MEKGKIQNLISQMTLEEKAGMCSGADFWHLKGVERLGIPSVMVTDGPHGLRKQAQGADHLGINESEKAICFPAGCATASSFDRDLIRRQRQMNWFRFRTYSYLHRLYRRRRFRMHSMYFQKGNTDCHLLMKHGQMKSLENHIHSKQYVHPPCQSAE